MYKTQGRRKTGGFLSITVKRMEERFGTMEKSAKGAWLQVHQNVELSTTMCCSMMRKYKIHINNIDIGKIYKEALKLFLAKRLRRIRFGSL